MGWTKYVFMVYHPLNYHFVIKQAVTKRNINQVSHETLVRSASQSPGERGTCDGGLYLNSGQLRAIVPTVDRLSG